MLRLDLGKAGGESGMTVEQLENAGRRPMASGSAWQQDASRPRALELRDLLGILRRRKWTVIISFVLVTGLAMVAAYRITPEYEATSSVMIDVRDRTLGEDIKAFVSGLPAGEETIQSEIAVISSRNFADRLAQRLTLYERPEFNPALREPGYWQKLIGSVKEFVGRQLANITGADPTGVRSIEEQFDRERVQVISALLGKINVVPRDGTWVIDITVRSEEPDVAARIANTAAELYLVDQLEAKYESTKRATNWLTQRLSDLRADLEKAEDAVEAYRSSSGLLRASGDATLAQQQIANVNDQLVAARVRREEVEARLRQAESLLNSPAGARAAGEVLQSPVIQNLLAQETQVLREVAELASSYGENFPALISARAEARDLRARLTTEIGKVVESLRSEAEIAREQEQSLERSLGALEARVSGLNSKEGELRILEREAETNRLLYETFLSRFKETEEQEEIQQSDARIISRADVPLGPVYPNKLMHVSLAAVFSLLLASVVVALQEQFERGLRSMEDVYRHLKLPCLGLVPSIPNLPWAGKFPERYVVNKPTSAFAEAVRSIRTGLLMVDSDAKTRVIVVTSAQPNEGKTTIATSMARLNAMGGHRSILLDFDLRKPEIHARFDARADAGVIDYLMGRASLEDVIQTDELTGMNYIVAGRRASNFAELLRSKQLEDLLSALGQEYDLVVIDTPPILALADARLIARLADKTVMVVRWGETPRDVVQLALQQLADADVDVAGIAISRVDVRRNAKYGFSDSGAYTGAFKRYYAS